MGTRLLPPVNRAARAIGRWCAGHRVAAGVLAALVVLAVGASIDLLRIASRLADGRSEISGLSLDSLDAGLVPTMDTAAGQLASAHDIARSSPFLGVLSLVPVLGTQVDGVRDLTDLGDRLGEEAVRTAQAIDVVLEAAGDDPAQRVTLMDAVIEELDRVEAVIDGLDVGATGRLIGPLADARSKVVRELDEVPERFDEARGYAQGLRRLLAGPTRYFVMAGNNAEMRGGAGMPLSGGVVTITNGDIEFGEFQQLAYLEFGRPKVDFPPVWKTTYFRWNIGNNFPESAVSPNFEVTGPIYRTMAEAAGFGPVDGVLQVDAVALAELLAAIGPVDVDGVTYDAFNIAQKVLNENYLSYDTLDERGNRVELQATLAAAIFQAFKDRGVPVTTLAEALRKSAQGRHLLAHSVDPAVQDLWESVGAEGAIPDDGLMVTVQNTSADKLDWFIKPSVTVNMIQGIDGSWKGRLTVAVENPVPPPGTTNGYIDGSFAFDTMGNHRALVAVFLPDGAYNIRSLDVPLSEFGEDPPVQMAGMRIQIPRGTTKRVAIEFQLPKEQTSATILPSGRVQPVEYTVNNVVLDDAVQTVATWLPPKDDSDTPGAPAVAAVLSLAGTLALVVGARGRMRVQAVRPIPPLPIFVQRAPSLAAVLYLGALATLIAGAVISAGAT